MGQKTNPKILRLGTKEVQWYSRFYEKNIEEFTLYNYQTIKIQNYLKQFFHKNGLVLQSAKFYFNNTNLYIYISYLCTKKAFNLIKTNTRHKRIKIVSTEHNFYVKKTPPKKLQKNSKKKPKKKPKKKKKKLSKKKKLRF